MRMKFLTITALLAFASGSQAFAQQTTGQDNQSDTTPARQTTSATWSTPVTAPEQAGDLYQTETRSNGNFGNASTPDAQGGTPPGAFDPPAEPLGTGERPEPKE